MTTTTDHPGRSRMPAKPPRIDRVRILHIEDDPAITSLVTFILHQTDPDRFVVQSHASLGDAGPALMRTHRGDLVLLDLNLPDSQGWNTFATLHRDYPGLPLVILTGDPDEELAMRAVQEGAQDYLLKSEIRVPGLLARVIRYAVERHHALEEIETARRQLAQQNDQLQAALQSLEKTSAALVESEKIKSLGQMAAGIAHELKNPLAILRMGLDYIQRAAPERRAQAQERVMSDLFGALHRADDIIADLMAYSAPSPLQAEPASLNRLIEEAVEIMRPLLLQHHIEYELRLAAELPELPLDRKRILQLLVNLISNAVQAMSPSGERGRLQISTQAGRMPAESTGPDDTTFPEPLLVTAEFRDNGPGIPAEALPHVFDPFFTTKAAQGGTGLGLAVSAMIMDLHGGRLELTNHPDGGAVAKLIFIA